ncbi:MAG: GAF domain-containing protein [Elusimicrobiales bacterium]
MADIHKLRIPEIALLRWRSIADLLAQVADVPAATINIIEEDSLCVIGASTGPDKPFAESDVVKIKPGMRLYCSAVIQAREKLIVPDATKSDFWKDSEGARAGFIAYAGVPVMQPDGDIFGSICLFDRKPNNFEGPTLRLMEEFSDIINGHLSLIAKNTQLEETLKEVRTLQGLIPICANCKKIRDDKGFWQKVEVYLEGHSNARFTHGLCEDCIQKLYGHEKWFKEKDK